MDEVAALALAGEPEGTVVLADEQTAGRGRAGRSWRAPAASSILCSVLLRPAVPPHRLATLPLLVGVAVAETIETTVGLPCLLKWPNDVWLGVPPIGRKVAGILLAARSHAESVDHALVGIGLNVNIAPTDLPPGATSLQAATGRLLDRAELLDSLLDRLDAAYLSFAAAADLPSLDGWRARAALLNETVVVDVAGRRRSGIMRGVARDGALLLEEKPGAILRIVAGDLTRGPVVADARQDRLPGRSLPR
jgi:BirA family biotin operon repressor/biotin-[acetyl-CoA-carboxylase] ligase